MLTVAKRPPVARPLASSDKAHQRAPERVARAVPSLPYHVGRLERV